LLPPTETWRTVAILRRKTGTGTEDVERSNVPTNSDGICILEKKTDTQKNGFIVE